MGHDPTRPNERRRAILRALGLAALTVPFSRADPATPNTAWRSSFAPFDGPLGPRFDGELSCPALPVEGRLPDSLCGTLYRNGPARMRFGSTPYQHWFDGDGMVQQFRIGAGRVAHRGVLLRTPKLRAEEAAGRFLYPSFATDVENELPVRSADEINVANINLLAMPQAGALYALWEGGSAVELEPDTLQVLGFKKWSPESAGAPFCAHPRLEPDGSVWAFGYLPGRGQVLIYRIAASGALVRQTLVALPQADMVHDFAITERYLVFLLMPLAFRRESTGRFSFASHFTWQDRQPLRVALVDKSDLSVQHFEVPTDGLFHIGNAWEERGMVRVGYVSQPEIDALIRGRGIDAPYPSDSSSVSSWKELEIDPVAKRVRVIATDAVRVEFPRYDLRLTGQKSAWTVLLERSRMMPGAVEGFDSVLTLGPKGMQRFRYGEDWIAEEHIFVADPDSRGLDAGFLVGTAYDWRAERTALSVFHARDVAAGPVARVLLPYGLPLGLHGQFIAQT
jgi:carotenoid cleavage dioxygenase-like enzyme